MRSVFLASALLWLISTVATAGVPTIGVTKTHRQLHVAGKLVGDWVIIKSATDRFPRVTRKLYESENDELLVIRTTRMTDVGPTVVTIEYPASGEIIAFDIVSNDSLTVSFGGERVVISYSDCIAYAGSGGTRFPPEVKADAAALFHNLSAGFRAALRTYAERTCSSRVLDNFADVVAYAHLFFDHIDCTAPPNWDPISMKRVVDFDPITSPPNEFERQFGRAYYE